MFKYLINSFKEANEQKYSLPVVSH